MAVGRLALLMLPLAALAGCVTVPPYEQRFDDGLSTLQEQVYDHYALLELDDTATLCDRTAAPLFWHDVIRSTDLLAIRSTYTPHYEAFHARLTSLYADFARYGKIEADLAAKAAAKGGKPCLPGDLAHIYDEALQAEIGGLLMLELTYKRGAAK